MPQVHVVRRRRLKYIRLSVADAQTLRVTVPMSYAQRDIDRLLADKRDWILDKFAHASDRARRAAAMPHLYLGKPLTIRHDAQLSRAAAYQPMDGVLTLRVHTAHVKLALQDWYRTQAQQFLPERVALLSRGTDIVYRRVFIRGQRSRWGTCSSQGNISLNWKLMQAPLSVIDYVIFHELAHVKQMNHSKKFWAIVAQLCPHFTEAKQWLKDHGELLKD